MSVAAQARRRSAPEAAGLLNELENALAKLDPADASRAAEPLKSLAQWFDAS